MTEDQQQSSNALWRIINALTFDLQLASSIQDWTRWKESFAARGLLFELEAEITNPEYGVYEPFIRHGLETFCTACGKTIRVRFDTLETKNLKLSQIACKDAVRKAVDKSKCGLTWSTVNQIADDVCASLFYE